MYAARLHMFIWVCLTHPLFLFMLSSTGSKKEGEGEVPQSAALSPPKCDFAFALGLTTVYADFMIVKEFSH
jgi:hypothetical protein